MTAKALRSIYQLKVTLKGIRPPIWRSFLIASTASLENVHHVLQIVMGWTDSHLHEFAKEDIRYGMPDAEFPSDVRNEAKYRLNQVLKQEKEKLLYTYDFGDGWEHEILLEKILPFEADAQLPVCLKGKRACPPEDVGGIWGYMTFLEAVSDPAHPEHDSMLEWATGDTEHPFDSEHFDLATVNEMLHG
jgi:hypothetical protein